MARLKTAKCKQCGKTIFVLAGKAAKYCRDVCFECRDAAEDARIDAALAKAEQQVSK